MSTDCAVTLVTAAHLGPPAPPYPPLMLRRDRLFDAGQCAALVGRVDSAYVKAAAAGPPPHHDFRLHLSRSELETLVGGEATQAFIRLGASALPPGADGSAPQLIVRRCAAREAHAQHCIPFHRDHSLAVASAVLSSTFEGGLFLFVLDGRVVCPSRPHGSALAHNCATVHGVSCLTAGVRYHLFAVFAHPA
eukprot:2650324-Prymnesium_polylepis.1